MTAKEIRKANEDLQKQLLATTNREVYEMATQAGILGILSEIAAQLADENSIRRIIFDNDMAGAE
jgi:hypothetical protein